MQIHVIKKLIAVKQSLCSLLCFHIINSFNPHYNPHFTAETTET